MNAEELLTDFDKMEPGESMTYFTGLPFDLSIACVFEADDKKSQRLVMSLRNQAYKLYAQGKAGLVQKWLDADTIAWIIQKR